MLCPSLKITLETLPEVATPRDYILPQRGQWIKSRLTGHMYAVLSVDLIADTCEVRRADGLHTSTFYTSSLWTAFFQTM